MSLPHGTVEGIRHAGILPTDSEELQLQKTLLIFATGLISFASMFWLFIYWQLGPQISSTIPFVFQLLLIANLALYLKTLNFELFRQTQLALFLFMPFVAQWSMGNFITASGVSLWALLAPVGAVLVIGAREALAQLRAQGLRLVGRVPDIGVFEFAADFLQPLDLQVVVKDTPSAQPADQATRQRADGSDWSRSCPSKDKQVAGDDSRRPHPVLCCNKRLQ